MTGELWITLEGESESGFTKKRIALRMADIDAVDQSALLEALAAAEQRGYNKGLEARMDL